MEKQDHDSVQPSDNSQPEGIESIYKGLKDVPLKALNFFIGACLVAFLILIAVGVVMSSQNI